MRREADRRVASSGALSQPDTRRPNENTRFQTARATTREDMRRDTHRPSQSSSGSNLFTRPA